jgi:hypothetical protein
VALAVGYDPTRIASDVPSNVELFINLYQATNLIGGGRATPSAGFRGRLVNVDLRERREIVHITLDKNSIIHELLTEKIVGLAELAAEKRAAAAAPRDTAQSRKIPPHADPQAKEVRPLVMRYVVPPNARIELWDSAVAITTTDNDTLQSVASRTGAPEWAIAQINNLDADAALQAGRRLLIPRNSYVSGSAFAQDRQSGTAIGASRKPSAAIR